MKFTPDKESISKHQIPKWFHDAKLGIFINWGLYSVPAFAVTGIDLVESMKKGLEKHYKNNPYAEWYLNSLRIQGSPTQEYHVKTYGKDFSYDDFAPIFNEAIKKWNPVEWVELFKKAGARYIVLDTKHHDGFLLWPSKYPNPKKKNYCASRDIVGELTRVVKKEGMKMGYYYSGALDWSFKETPITDAVSFLNNGPTDQEYVEYVDNHFRELINRYKPLILWNDIGYPPGTNINELFAYFYNKFPEGVVNNRWFQITEQIKKVIASLPEDVLIQAIKLALKPVEHKKRNKPGPFHYDFLTPEYEKYDKIIKTKWETCRGIGTAFSFNKFETEEDYMTSAELIRMFIDIISKNGNLLLSVGPMMDGTIPEIQKNRLLDLGTWLKLNGEAIYKTRPWEHADCRTFDDIEVRFTQSEKALYVFLLDKPKKDRITIKSLIIENNSDIQLLGQDKGLDWKQEGENLSISIPKNLGDFSAFVFKITPKPLY